MVAYLIVGYDVLWSAMRNILHGEVFDENFLMALASISAICIGEYREAVAVMLFYGVGELFSDIAVGKSRKSIAALMDIRPDYAVVLRNGVERKVSPDEVEVGEIIIIKPFERIPLDGTIIEGETSVNTSSLTGEALPSDKTIGDSVMSGTINLSSVIKVEVKSAFAESTVSKILELVQSASDKKTKSENFITRFAKIYTPCDRRLASCYRSASALRRALERLDNACAHLPGGFLPLCACHFRSTDVFRRHRRSLSRGYPDKRLKLYGGLVKG